MSRSGFAWGIAGALSAVLVVLLAAGGAIGSRRDTGVVERAYGPGGHSYRFEVDAAAAADPALAGCVVCHSLEQSGIQRVAPGLWGIVDAKKARAAWYGYSDALRRAGGVWSEAELDKFLAAPNAYLPGTTKTLTGFDKSTDRARIIAALRRLRD